MTVDDSVEKVENEAGEEESAVGEKSCARHINHSTRGKSRANHEVITNAEATAICKLARNAGKKKSRKRKNRVFADSRGRLKRRREGE
ncbi:hypothetical protein M405DRAFT_937411 [Rhizopogon salebrosus TDB-379]|nr:hypothetical protein M405DRAFT_937411 [Rhizopogon salebrosus TDB-379]